MKTQCHCGNIQIEVDRPEKLTSCNCSICTRYQGLWGYYAPESPIIEVGEEGGSSYSWGDKGIAFIHCKNCGCVTHYLTVDESLSPRTAVNFCMAVPSEIEGIPVRFFNGAELI